MTLALVYSIHIKVNLKPSKLNLVDEFMKLSKARSPIESFTADFWQYSGTIVKIYLFGGRLGTHHRFQAFQGFSSRFLISEVFSRSVISGVTHTFTFWY